MRCHVKCAGCRKQSTLAHKPDWYIKIPKCKNCNGIKYWIIKPAVRVTCHCDGYPYLHSYLSPNCNDRVLAEQSGSDYRMFNNPVLGRK